MSGQTSVSIINTLTTTRVFCASPPHSCSCSKRCVDKCAQTWKPKRSASAASSSSLPAASHPAGLGGAPTGGRSGAAGCAPPAGGAPSAAGAPPAAEVECACSACISSRTRPSGRGTSGSSTMPIRRRFGVVGALCSALCVRRSPFGAISEPPRFSSFHRVSTPFGVVPRGGGGGSEFLRRICIYKIIKLNHFITRFRFTTHPFYHTPPFSI